MLTLTPQDGADWDSAYALSMAPTDTTSLKSSIMHYKWEHGRRYHAFGAGLYWYVKEGYLLFWGSRPTNLSPRSVPNDAKQQEAEDLVLYLAPLPENPQKILDLGCGTGIWVIDLADQHPSAEVIGVDISPIQPSYIPPNCRFEIDDINRDWTYPEDAFDLVHARALVGCVPDWAELDRRVLRHLRPGGWLEHVELSVHIRCDDNSLPAGSSLAQWGGLMAQVYRKIGRSAEACEVAMRAAEEAGFACVREHRVKVPIGMWPKHTDLKQWGAWNRAFMLQGLEGFALRGLTTILGWSYEQAQMYLMGVRNDLNDPNIHAYVEMCVVNGQKPF
ncbi:uncharacterized protein E0L32_007734 [Thyridium curvatum]|uniref:S-adenosyl-L-methionine-dependent methyltransferase n=1 Tax=Thyridium curvatum TaxID=1093900 RepID=A0A507AUW8_9PEZI|nr:uncharacterized protein E0L32_007734 [Thyridium curvatum]TPX11523.1 hypothetical protein E0L32_007734 [Thyridium curvatum]